MALPVRSQERGGRDGQMRLLGVAAACLLSGLAGISACKTKPDRMVVETAARPAQPAPPALQRASLDAELEAVGVTAFAPSAEPTLDRYDAFAETGFVSVRDHPLSTFSIDVDTASYSNLRRFLQEGTKPPRGAVRIEEMLNYFRYPTDATELETTAARPIALDTELFAAPWQPDHQLLRVAIAGRAMPVEELPPRNLVLLVDVSGSMDGPDRLPWVKRGLVELV